MDILDQLKSEFAGHLAIRTKRPNVLQILAPLFHEDGDMVEIYLDLSSQTGDKVVLSDHGMTLMRLSYNFDVDTPARRKILDRILSENGVTEDCGRLSLEASPNQIYPSLLQFAQAIAKVGSMQAFKREVIHSLFYESLGDFIETNLRRYNPSEHFTPIPERDDLDVDWRFAVAPRDIYLYGVKDNAKARLATLSCLEFQLREIPFRSIIVHEDFANGLSRKDQARITSAADKQFTSLEDFMSHGEKFFARELVSERPN